MQALVMIEDGMDRSLILILPVNWAVKGPLPPGEPITEKRWRAEAFMPHLFSWKAL